MVVGLGFFLSYIALSGKVASPHLGAGIIVPGTATMTILGDLKQPVTLITIFGILLTSLLTIRRFRINHKGHKGHKEGGKIGNLMPGRE